MFKYLFKFFNMGGYGIYVWPCYALLLIIFSWAIWSAIKREILLHNKIKQSNWSGTDSDQQT